MWSAAAGVGRRCGGSCVRGQPADGQPAPRCPVGASQQPARLAGGKAGQLVTVQPTASWMACAAQPSVVPSQLGWPAAAQCRPVARLACRGAASVAASCSPTLLPPCLHTCRGRPQQCGPRDHHRGGQRPQQAGHPLPDGARGGQRLLWRGVPGQVHRDGRDGERRCPLPACSRLLAAARDAGWAAGVLPQLAKQRSTRLGLLQRGNRRLAAQQLRVPCCRRLHAFSAC